MFRPVHGVCRPSGPRVASELHLDENDGASPPRDDVDLPSAEARVSPEDLVAGEFEVRCGYRLTSPTGFDTVHRRLCCGGGGPAPRISSRFTADSIAGPRDFVPGYKLLKSYYRTSFTYPPCTPPGGPLPIVRGGPMAVRPARARSYAPNGRERCLRGENERR